MATITEYTRVVSTPNKSTYTSDAATIASSDVVMMLGLEPYFRHGYIGVHMFDALGARVVGGAGTFTVTILTENTGDDLSAVPVTATYETPTASVITAATPVTLALSGNIIGIKVVEAGVSTAITWKAVYTTNAS